MVPICIKKKLRNGENTLLKTQKQASLYLHFISEILKGPSSNWNMFNKLTN